MKKVALTLFSIVLALFTIISSAGAEPNQDSYQSDIQSIQKGLLAHLQSLNPQTKEDAESEIAKYFSEHPVNEEVVASYYAQENQKTLLPESEGITTPEQDFIGYMKDNIAQNNFTEYAISDELKIIFTNSPVYFVESITNNQPIDLQSSNFSVSAVKASKQTDIKTWTYDANNILGLKLFEVGVKGYFTYNGANSNGHLVDAWYKKGLASVWQVSNWDKGVRSIGNGKSRVYASGNFHWGAEIKGYGFTIQDVYVNLYLEGDKNGGILYNKEIH